MSDNKNNQDDLQHTDAETNSGDSDSKIENAELNTNNKPKAKSKAPKRKPKPKPEKIDQEPDATGASTNNNHKDWAQGEPDVTNNKLLQWSGAVLSLAPRLSCLSKAPDDLDAMQQKLCTIIKTIEANMHADGYSPQHTLATRYLLCALIDETILDTQWGKKSNWENISLLSVFQRDRWESKDFFQILQRSAEEPHENIDFLELTYYALRLGFHGHHELEEQQQSLNIIKDNLLQCLQQQRRDPAHELFAHHNTPSKKSYKHPYPHFSARWLVISVIVIVAIISGANSLSRYNKQKTVVKQIQDISNNLAHSNNNKLFGEQNAK